MTTVKLKLQQNCIYYARLPDKNMTQKVKLLQLGAETLQVEYRIDGRTTQIQSYKRDMVVFHDKSRSGIL